MSDRDQYDDEEYEEGEGTGLEIAIVGMAGRFPGAPDLDTFWQNLADGVESITFFSDEELDAKGQDPAVYSRPNYVKAARLIEDPERFDAAFFQFSPREAELMDPQQRLLMECAWATLEHAGYDTQRFDGLVGVFAGSKMSSYLLNVYSNPEVVLRAGPIQLQIGNDKDHIATRISYKLGLGGPSVTVQSACSTSLVAVHLASQSLLSGECDLALAGGVSVVTPDMGYLYREGEIFSADGHIRTFDAGANGTIFGNGLGMVALKRLEDALEDGDTIHAVLKGSAINNDGALKVGYTAPGADGQERVIRTAQQVAEVDAESISYIEAHGTGTPTGDPMEITALTRVFREKTAKKGFCAIGTVKTNIGHLSAAAGIAGLIKTTLALKHRQIPASLLFETPNPQIDFENSPFFVNTALRDWPANGEPRRAGISSFGIGGTNAHAIVEEAPEPESGEAPKPQQLLLISARTATALESATDALADHLESHPEVELADEAYTLQVGRRAFEHRRTLVCADRADAVDALRNRDPKRLRTVLSPRSKQPVAFLFSGQGAQYAGMGRDLYASERVFRQAVDECCTILTPHLGQDLRDLLYPPDGDLKAATATLEQTRFTQPALFVIEYATARLWMSWGIEPQALIGHSIGEYVAACLAGVFSLEAALGLVATRGRLMQSLPAGAMLAVPLSEEDLTPRLDSQLSIAALNAPGRAVVSGPQEAVDAFAARLKEDGIKGRPLHTSHAFHSSMMEPILGPFIEAVSKVERNAPKIPCISNVSGTWMTADEATDPSYWANHLRNAVRFADGVGELLRQTPAFALIEVGPGNTLVTLSQRHPDRGGDHLLLPSLRHPKKALNDLGFLLDAAGRLWMNGLQLDWQAVHDGRRQRVPLPTYPFERQRFWLERPKAGLAAIAGDAPRPVERRQDIADWFYLPAWQPSLPPAPTDEAIDARRWLVFVDDTGFGARLAARLAARGCTVATVAPGAGYEAQGDGAYTVAAGQRADYNALLDDLAAQGELPDGILHLWGLGAEEAALDTALDQSFYSLLYLAQALGARRPKSPLHIAAVSSHLQRLPGETGALHPTKALALGPCQVIPREYPQLVSTAIDVALPAAESTAEEALADLLIAEATDPTRGASLAYRDGERWQRGYDPVRLDRTASTQLALRQGGCYLITGGLGGFGLTFADHLAREFNAKLILLGRSPLPGREAWEGWLAEHGEDDNGSGDKTSRTIRRLQALEAAGGEVMHAAVDVTDEAALRQVLADGAARFGALHGVIHAAGVPGGGLMQLKTAAMAAAVLAPKVQGTLALDAALGATGGDTPLDFMLLCSSTIAVLGTFGQVDYCAANAFLDAFAEARTARDGGSGSGSGYTIAVNWGAWQDVGMAATPATTARPGASPTAPPKAEGTPATPVTIERDASLHPLLDRRIEDHRNDAGDGDAGEATYATALSAARHWILDEHRIVDRPTLPGTGYLEWARAAYGAHSGASGAELRDVFFVQPLIMGGDETREGRVRLEANKDGRFDFAITSRGGAGLGKTDDGEATWLRHAQGTIGPLADGDATQHDLQALLARCPEVTEVDGGLDRSKKAVYWGPRWQCLRRIHRGDGEAVLALELPAEFAADLEDYRLHPALLDVATALISTLDEGSGGYLPLSYGRLRCRHGLPAALFSHVKLHSAGAKAETLSADVLLLDSEGNELVAIERFTMKRVGEPKGRPAADATPAAENPAAAAGFAAGGMRPEEGVEVLRRVLSRVRKPRIIASPKDLEGMRRQLAAPRTAETAGEAPAAAAPAAAPQTQHPRPDLPTPYAAPESEAERRLAAVWQDVLGIEEVGIHDNFFDLGGDSVLGITLVSRSREAGLAVAPEQLFEHQTIAELAAVLDVSDEALTETAPPAETAPTAADAPEPESTEEPDFADSGLAPDQLDAVLAKLKGLGG